MTDADLTYIPEFVAPVAAVILVVFGIGLAMGRPRKGVRSWCFDFHWLSDTIAGGFLGGAAGAVAATAGRKQATPEER